jgi:hypothetical protein
MEEPEEPREEEEVEGRQLLVLQAQLLEMEEQEPLIRSVVLLLLMPEEEVEERPRVLEREGQEVEVMEDHQVLEIMERMVLVEEVEEEMEEEEKWEEDQVEVVLSLSDLRLEASQLPVGLLRLLEETLFIHLPRLEFSVPTRHISHLLCVWLSLEAVAEDVLLPPLEVEDQEVT